MTMTELENIQQQLFFEYGRKVDLHHFEKSREIVVVEHMQELTPQTVPLKVFSY